MGREGEAEQAHTCMVGRLARDASEVARPYRDELRAKVVEAEDAIHTQVALVAELKQKRDEEIRYQVQQRTCLEEYMEDVQQKLNMVNLLCGCGECAIVRECAHERLWAAEERVNEAAQRVGASEARRRRWRRHWRSRSQRQNSWSNPLPHYRQASMQWR
jgi:hypothetical protein